MTIKLLHCGGLVAESNALERLYMCNLPAMTSLEGLMPSMSANSVKFIDVSAMDTSNVTNMKTMFAGCSKLEEIRFGSEHTNSGYANISAWNTENVTDMSAMFTGCSSLKSIDLTLFNANSVIYMNSMFDGCSSLTELDLSSLKDNKCTSIGGLLQNCSSLERLTLCSFKNMTNYSGLLVNLACNNYVKEIDASKMDTSNATNMSSMFCQCPNLETIDLTNLNTDKVTDMTFMFGNCPKLQELDLTSFNTSSATAMQAMFNQCIGLTKIKVGSGWDYPRDENDARGNNMFSGCGVSEVTK